MKDTTTRVHPKSCKHNFLDDAICEEDTIEDALLLQYELTKLSIEKPLSIFGHQINHFSAFSGSSGHLTLTTSPIACDMEILAYFFAPLGLLLLINLFLFAATAWELTCGLWKTEVVKASTERAALGRVCVKLVIMMGLTWVLDIVSWAVGGPSYLWYLPDLLNTLQGVFIFIVVGCHPQVWAAVKRNCLGERTNRTLARHQLSSVSQASRSALDTTNTTKIIPLETMC
uniref:Uncharacterized protein n=3 Tax=Timema TaxID=61471 RepID=A0A7R9CPG7_TIMCR|nr:unnamed protein product [Timema cristinae]